MTIDLYTNSSDPRVLDKTITAIASDITCRPALPFDILSPRIILSYTAANAAANYAYISELGRYYYISSVQLLTGLEMQLNLKVDVLKTYSSQIKSCTGTVIRSESVGKPGIYPDSKLPIDPNRMELQSIKFNKRPFQLDYETDAMYLLMIRGVEVEE